MSYPEVCIQRAICTLVIGAVSEGLSRSRAIALVLFGAASAARLLGDLCLVRSLLVELFVEACGDDELEARARFEALLAERARFGFVLDARAACAGAELLAARGT